MRGEFDAKGLADAITAARARGELPSLTPLVDSLRDNRTAAEIMREPVVVISGGKAEDVARELEGMGVRVVRADLVMPQMDFDASRVLAEGVAAIERAADPPPGFRAVVREKRRREKCKRSRHGRR